LGSTITDFAAKHKYKNAIEILGIHDVFPEHGTIAELQDIVGISPDKIRQVLLDVK